MVTVIGVRFKKAGKVYYFDPNAYEINKGDAVIVETARGVEYGNVVIGEKKIRDDELAFPLKKVIRVAGEQDEKSHEENKRKAEEALHICEEKVLNHNLKMKLVDVEYTFDNNKIIFYFTADGRVDFRELVKDLASVFRTRIELRQIGVRDEAKMLNGIGPCGCGLCCANWLGDFAPVSIKMAKDQNLSLNPAKISGICGRLMCCLRYEHETYVKLKKEMPRRSEEVMTPEGPAIVIDPVILKESVKVRLIVDEKTKELGEDILIFPKDSVQSKKKCSKANCKCPKEQTKDDYREAPVVAEASPENEEQSSTDTKKVDTTETKNTDLDCSKENKKSKNAQYERKHFKNRKKRN